MRRRSPRSAWSNRRRGPGRSRADRRAAADRVRRLAAQSRGHGPDADAEISASVFRRPAARIGIARALAVKPRLPRLRRSGGRARRLDPGAGAQSLHAAARGAQLTYLFISHDLGVVRHISDRVVVMYLGRVVERAPTAELFAAPEPSVHAGAARRGRRRSKRSKTRLRADQGRDSFAARAARGMPFPSPLPLCHASCREARRRCGRSRRGAAPPAT